MYKLKTSVKKILADTITPVSIYLKIRDQFPNSILLESSDYRANDNNFSYICCNPISNFKLENNTISIAYPNGTEQEIKLENKKDLITHLDQYIKSFKEEDNNFKFITNGLFGYTAYDTVEYFEDLSISEKANSQTIPLVQYSVFKNVIAIDHFKNEAYIFCHTVNEDENNVEDIYSLITSRNHATFKFTSEEETTSNLTDEEFIEQVRQAKKHCLRGDVFQLVLSRKFSKKFKGDEFNVYRALRSINPSPYLFYFDYGDFKIFGSSPEAQLVIKDNITEIHPIAGTFRRTGNDEKDAELAVQLVNDDKENREHVMLVDLARNDLSRHCAQVEVEKYKEIQYFSHVIHLVSKVIGEKKKDASSIQIVADTFPAGTLSGAPKHRAMQLIDKYEKTNRGFYGGAIGYIGFNGNYNNAIMIRTFLSKNHELHWQAGAGIVSKSSEESELQEVYNKLGALNNAIELAENEI